MARRKPTTTEQGLGRAWQLIRPRILIRDGYRCHWCGGRANEVDHLVARSQGGARYDPANLVAACRTCNARRGGQLVGARPGPARARRVWPGAIDLDDR